MNVLEGSDGRDWQEIWMLLQIAKESALHPKLKNITNGALAILEEIANPPEPVEEIEEPAGDAEAPKAPPPPDNSHVEEQPSENLGSSPTKTTAGPTSVERRA